MQSTFFLADKIALTFIRFNETNTFNRRKVDRFLSNLTKHNFECFEMSQKCFRMSKEIDKESSNIFDISYQINFIILAIRSVSAILTIRLINNPSLVWSYFMQGIKK